MKASGQSIKIKKIHVKGKKTNESKKSKKGNMAGDTEDEDSASTSSSLKKGSKDLKKRKMEENTSLNLSKAESATCIKKPKKDECKELSLCRYLPVFSLVSVAVGCVWVPIPDVVFFSMILTDMEAHEDAWPFLLPVNLKLVPGYRKVIKKPMDFSTIREKLNNGQ